MYFNHFTVAHAVFLFLLVGTAVSANQIKDDATENQKSIRHRTKLDAKDALKNDAFEEDEKLWERILQTDLSITFPPTLPPVTPPPTPPPITAVFTLSPTSLPIMAEDEECELMVRFYLWN